MLRAIDPFDCGCTECILGEYTPLAFATDDDIADLLAGRLISHLNTGDELVVSVSFLASYGSLDVAASPVTVTYTHGWDEVPGDIAAIVLQAANRVIVNPSGIRSETVGGESVTYLIPAAGEYLGVLLSRTEEKVLDRYRRTAGTVNLRSR